MTRGVCTARSHALYVLILGCIARKPMTAPEIAEELDIGRCSVWPVLRRLRGIVAHVSDYRRAGKLQAAVWSFGVGVEPPPPAGIHRDTVPKMRAELGAFAQLASMLLEPVTTRQLLEQTGMSRTTIYMILRLAKKQRIAHIADWDRDRWNGPYAPCWAFGVAKKDAPRPAPVPRSVIHARSWRGRAERRKQQQVMAALALTNGPGLQPA